MALNEDFDIVALRDANREIHKLEEAAIDRARLFLETQGVPTHTFKNEDGFSVRVNRDSLLEASYVDVVFYHTDVQGRGATKTVTVPRSVILGQETDEEREFAEYKRLQAKFEK
jgi:hypothetical protein